MRVAYIPGYTSRSDLSNCSTFLWAKDFFMEWVKRDEDVFIYFCYPSHVTHEVLDVVRHPRIRLLPVTSLSRQNSDQFFFPPELYDYFNEVTGKYIVDSYFCDKLHVVPWIKSNLLTFVGRSGVAKPVVSFPHFIFTKKNHAYFREELFALQTYGLEMTDLVLVQSEGSKQSLIKEAAKYLPLAKLKKVSECIKVGIVLGNQGSVINYRDMSKKKNKVTEVSWAYSFLQGGYEPDEVFKGFDELYSTGRQFRVKVTTTSDRTHSYLDRDYIDIHLQCDQEKFFDIVSGCHTFVYWAKSNEVSNSVIEQMFLGCVGLLLDTPRNRTLCYEDYPFFFTTYNEMVKKLGYVLGIAGTDEFFEIAEKQFDYMMEMFDADKVYDEVFPAIRELAERGHDIVRNSSNNLKLVLFNIFKNRSRITFAKWKKMIKEMTDIGFDIDNCTNTYGIGKSFFYSVMLEHGFRDTLESEFPVFEKESNHE